MEPAPPRVRLAGTTVDCRDVGVVSGFWSALLQAPLRESLPGWRRLGPLTADGPVLTFQPVQDPSPGARVHLDLAVDDLDGAVRTVLALGGSGPHQRHEYDEGTVLVVADPEGNAFCLVHHLVPPV